MTPESRWLIKIASGAADQAARKSEEGKHGIVAEKKVADSAWRRCASKRLRILLSSLQVCAATQKPELFHTCAITHDVRRWERLYGFRWVLFPFRNFIFLICVESNTTLALLLKVAIKVV
jgi:hypothetical protein